LPSLGSISFSVVVGLPWMLLFLSYCCWLTLDAGALLPHDDVMSSIFILDYFWQDHRSVEDVPTGAQQSPSYLVESRMHCVKVYHWSCLQRLHIQFWIWCFYAIISGTI